MSVVKFHAVQCLVCSMKATMYDCQMILVHVICGHRSTMYPVMLFSFWKVVLFMVIDKAFQRSSSYNLPKAVSLYFCCVVETGIVAIILFIVY